MLIAPRPRQHAQAVQGAVDGPAVPRRPRGRQPRLEPAPGAVEVALAQGGDAQVEQGERGAPRLAGGVEVGQAGLEVRQRAWAVAGRERQRPQEQERQALAPRVACLLATA